MWRLQVAVFFAFFVIVAVSSDDNNRKGDASNLLQCRDCYDTKDVSCLVETCQCADCTLISSSNDTMDDIEMHKTFYRNLLPPTLYCQDENLFALSWHSEEGTSYFLEYATTRNREFTNLTNKGHEILTNIEPGISYVIQLTSVSLLNNEVMLRRSRPISFRSLRPNRTPFPVSKLYLDSLLLQDHKYTALVKWEQAGDRSCYYDIMWFGQDNAGDYKTLDIDEPLSPHEVNITGIDFGQEYELIIKAVSKGLNGRTESSEVILTFTAPTCLETFQSLEDCIPDVPQDFEVEESIVGVNSNGNHPIYNVELSWSRPNLTPDYYTAYLHNFLKNDSQKMNITGNSTTATYKNIELGIYYEIWLTAYSKMGSSPTATLYRYLNTSSNFTHSEESGVSTEVILVLVFPFIIVGLAMMLICNHCLVKRVRSNYFKETGEKDIPPANRTANEVVPEEKSDEWEIQIERLLLKDVLGEGAFGIVRRGCYINENGNSIDVAIKMLRDNPTSDELKQFYQEIDIMKSVPPHPHLVSLIGCMTKGDTKWPLLVVECCSKGDLQSYLRSAWDKLTNLSAIGRIEAPNTKYASNILYDLHNVCTEKDIPQPKDLISFARQITLGMEYLSSLKLIHRDLAARNVLVCENNTIKISDFGLSRDVYHNNIYCKTTGGKLPVRWMALESITHQIYTTHSDVWSFGILLWEIVTLGSTPYPGVATKDLLSLLKSGYRMEKPSNCSDELYSVMCKCWKASPRERPTFSELRSSLDLILERVSNYLDLNISHSSDFSMYINYNNEINKYKNVNLPTGYVNKIKGLNSVSNKLYNTYHTVKPS